MTPKSKANWGVRKERNAAELNALCDGFFAALVVPREWKFERWDLAREPNGNLVSVGKIYMDKRTQGMKLMHYRVAFTTYSERGLVLERSIKDYGKYAYRCVTSNLTINELNEYIKEHYEQLDKATEANDEQDDGLQSFRDRFGAGVAEKATHQPPEWGD